MNIINSRNFFIIVLSIFFIIGILIVPDYGISGDENTQYMYGNYVWDYMKNMGDPKVSFDSLYKGEMTNMKYYGGFFDGILSMLIDVFGVQNKFLFRHYVIFFVGFLGLVYLGLFSKRITGNWFISVLAIIFAIFTPRYFGELFNNPKDIPFATGYIASCYYMLLFFQNISKPKWYFTIMTGIWIGFTMAIRMGGVMVAAYFVLFLIIFYFVNRAEIDIKNLGKHLTALILLSYVILISWWPYAHNEPISALTEAISLFSKFPVQLFMIHDGMRINTTEVPQDYLITWYRIGQPIFFIIGLIGFIVLSLVKGLFKLDRIFVLFIFLFPILYIILKHSIVHDGLRHVLFTLPVLAMISAIFINDLVSLLGKSKTIAGAIYGVTLIALIHPIKHTFANHPNQYVYFNELFGGIEKAVGYYELDYYCNSAKVATDWIIDYVKKNEQKPVKIMSNIGTHHLYYYNQDSTKIKGDYVRWRERDQNDWDYYVAYTRFLEPEYLQAGHFPPGEVVYEVKVDGVPVTAVMKRKSKYDMQAQVAMKNKDLTTASELYAKHLAIDPSNEYAWINYAIALANSGKLQEGAQAASKAININSSNPEWMKIAAQLYQQAGDMNNANKYKSMAASKISEVP